MDLTEDKEDLIRCPLEYEKEFQLTDWYNDVAVS